MKVNLTFNQQEKTTVEIRKVIISSKTQGPILPMPIFLTFNYQFDFRD